MTNEALINTLSQSMKRHLYYSLGKDEYSATDRDCFTAAALAARDLITHRWIETQQAHYDVDTRRVYYLSLEFLMGRLLNNYILNLGLTEEFQKAAAVLDLPLEDLLETEMDTGLGNGGLGRLAACYMDSMASLGYPGYGYGIRYEFGIFYQRIRDGYQVEIPDNWLRYGNAWEFPRPEVQFMVNYGGRVNSVTGRNGKMRMEWVDTDNVMAMAFDYPVLGYGNRSVNTLRLWSARSTRELNLQYFNSGDYMGAVQDKNHSESISKVLYPNDQSPAGKELRLKQQYFFIAATLQDILRRYQKHHDTFDPFPEKVAIQLNDTHPAIAVPEMMRIFLDEEGLDWEDAWSISRNVFSYTNHTILPEALETWPETLMGHLLPRHLQILQEIDRRFLIQVGHCFPQDKKKRENLAIITRNGEAKVHMARLAIMTSHTVNGVSKLHTDILQNSIFSDFHQMYPDRFINITNGVTPRRWIFEANPALTSLLKETIGDAWIRDLERLHDLEPLAEDAEFRRKFLEVKQKNKELLSRHLGDQFQLSFRAEHMLDCQVKRLHEYKRQLLNIFHVITLYNRLAEDREDNNIVPRTVLFGGKSAPGYFLSKRMIKLIHSVAKTVDAHPEVRNHLKVLFVPNYGVSAAQKIIPAADLSQQISTAGFEASGTGNMKFALNGALTLGTLDGANVEIREAVGEENFFLFGMTAEEIRDRRGAYDPEQVLQESPELKKIIHQLSSGFFCPEEENLFQPIVDSVTKEGDRFFVLADYEDYIRCQEEASRAYTDRETWARRAILNVARCGRFSSDRAVREYAEKVWKLEPLEI